MATGSVSFAQNSKKSQHWERNYLKTSTRRTNKMGDDGYLMSESISRGLLTSHSGETSSILIFYYLEFLLYA